MTTTASPTDAIPRRNRRVGAAVVVVLVAMFAWAVLKHAGTGKLSEVAIERGVAELRVAIELDDAARYEAAEDHFVDAGSVVVLDRYPAFLIHAGRMIRSASSGLGDEVARSLRAGDFAAARAACEVLERDHPEAARHWLRLTDALATARE